MPYSRQIVYLSQTQYTELITNGSITVNGATVTYNDNDIYVTPQAEPITDVRINGTSIGSNGVANVPITTGQVLGVIKTQRNSVGYFGTRVESDGLLAIVKAPDVYIKSGWGDYTPITPSSQHTSVFYGLARAAGSSMGASSNPVGEYTPEAKGAIQKMLGVSDLIATEENNLIASKAYAIGDVFTANGKLYKATAAIAADAAIIPAVEGEEIEGANCVETSVGEGFVKKTDYATNTTAGIVKVGNYGVSIDSAGNLGISYAALSTIKGGGSTFASITTTHQHEATFYGLAKAAGADEKDSTLPVGQYTDTAKAAIKSMIGVNVEDVQVNGTSVITDGVANVPVASTNKLGVIKPGLGLFMITDSNSSYFNMLCISKATDNNCKVGTDSYTPIVPNNQHMSAFYGLAKAAGDTTQSASSNTVGNYTDNAKASIKAMLGIQDGSTGTVDISGTDPVIAAVENTRYVCGEITSLDFTPPASGISIVRFTSGSTVTVLTLPSTVKFPEWFDPTSLETNTIYEICITDGVYGAVMSWAL